ncbi:MAG: hypothetical protein BWY59_00483 [Verrucomicrobia bacterium ADurb.Bin345]|nr:MAG: hypothetical protein BWY59_00483 [Verrucomicrobia bacterium ADurb.Bin345]
MSAMRMWTAAILALLTVQSVQAEVPLRNVVLFTSGVGYFERSAEIEGDSATELALKTDQMADLIKSLVLVDEGGGRISAVTYDARDPLDRTLKSFSVDLTDNPGLPALLNRMRGVPVRVKTASGELTGEVLGVEVHERWVDEQKFIECALNVFSDGVIKSVLMDQVQWFEPLDEKVRADLAAALDTLASGLDRDKKTIRLNFAGKDKRRVRVGYMLEAPVWKTSYRLVLDEKGSALLQGWAHIENTTDEDWRGVQLALVSGRPISFIQNLYDPIYLRRPVVQNELYASAVPQLYGGAVDSIAFGDESDVFAEQEFAAPKAFAVGRAGGARLRRQDAAMAPAPAMAPAEMLRETVQAAATGRETGELFSYPVDEPVTLPRRQSAMIPIVNKDVRLEKLSIYNEGADAKFPLNGVEFTNTTGLFLMQGPVSVFEDGIYAGDARLNDTARNEARLLSYAVDLASEVKPERKSAPERITSLKAVHGVLWVTRLYEDTTEYAVRNKRDKARRYLIEHPIRSDWELVEPAKGVEKTRDLYRCRTEVPAGKTEAVRFVERRNVSQSIMLSNISTDNIEFYLRQSRISSALKQALQKLAGLQAALAEVRAKRVDRERRVKEITDEQNRIRENMKAVARPSDSYSMWEGKLVQQEKELDRLRLEIEELRADEMKKQGEINDFIAKLNVE